MTDETNALTHWEAVLVRLSCTLWHQLHSARATYASMHVDPSGIDYDSLALLVMESVVQHREPNPPKRARTEDSHSPATDPTPWKGRGGVDAYLMGRLGLVKAPRYDEIDGILSQSLPEVKQRKSLHGILKRWYIQVWDAERGSAIMEVDPYSGAFDEIKTRDLIQNLTRVSSGGQRPVNCAFTRPKTAISNGPSDCFSLPIGHGWSDRPPLAGRVLPGPQREKW